MLSDLHIVLWITFTFVLAGMVKGIVGSGLPTISLGVLTTVIGLHPAMAVMLVPTIVTNVWQAVIGGHLRAVLVRLWPFLLPATATIWVGAMALTRVNVSLLSGLLGFLLALYGAIGLFGPAMAVPPRKEARIGVIAGCLNGILGGMTGSFGVPSIPYLQSIGLPRDQLIQALGILFTLSTAALAMALGGQKLLSVDLGIVSALALVPALVGMVLGQSLRRRLSEARFRKLFLASQIALGGYIVVRAAL